MMNLVNRTGQRLTQLFNQLDRRLKSQDKKERSSEVIGHEGGEDIHHKRSEEVTTDLQTV